MLLKRIKVRLCLLEHLVTESSVLDRSNHRFIQSIMRISERLIEVERLSLGQNMRIFTPYFIQVTALLLFFNICYRNDRSVSFIVVRYGFRTLCSILILGRCLVANYFDDMFRLGWCVYPLFDDRL